MNTIKELINLTILIIEIVLVIKLFISFKEIKKLTIENQTIKSIIQSIYNKQNQEFEKQNKKLDEILSEMNKNQKQ